MLRRLEKGLNTAKLKQANETSMSSVFPAVDSQSPQAETQFGAMIRPMDQYNTSGTIRSHLSVSTHVKCVFMTFSLWKSNV